MNRYQVGICICGGVLAGWIIKTLIVYSDLPRNVAGPIAGLLMLPVAALVYLAVVAAGPEA
jgi:fructose-specific phosphotransferase system IIC component